ncbi:extracellular solute-binding protein [Hansschlegelia quercus]|uniref:Extracellular solute-binding protein n=1 Tax=Hansschlegelia quercus TaxID=2528245 RepID=A0A4Q9GJ02_9HYPH|nr:extracellular solute-binding protein [Hansschlegelia quercus]TBN52418.1 extracellular solute-binding protein [Hansschlegelia quercus]
MSDSIAKPRLDRRSVLKAGAAGAAVALAMPSIIRPAMADDTIVLLTWETYHDDPWIEEWSRANNTKVQAIRIGSEDELFQQPFSGAVHPDVMYIETGSLARFKAGGLIVDFDVSQVPNAKNITPKLDWKKYASIDGKVQAVPYNWGTQPLMYDADVVKTTDSWSVLWDPAYEGKVNMFDDCSLTFPMIALHVGAKDPFNLTDDEFKKCEDALRSLRKQIRVIARGFDDASTIYAAGDAVLGYCQNVAVVTSLQQKGKNFKYSLPKEGTPTWIDCAGVSAKGNRPIVYKFLNDNLTPEWQSRFITSSSNNGVLNVADARKAGVKEETIKITNLLDAEDPSFWEKLVVFQKNEDLDRRLQIWNDFKSGTL